MQRIIREVEPPTPSTRVVSATHGATSRAASAAPHRTARGSRLLRGELDWIVMKALEKDRARRYDTASELAQDIRRHLAGEPVEAAPPSRSYRVTKFVRRNKGTVAAGAAVFLALVVGLVGTLWQARAAERQRARADEARADAEKIADFQSSALRRVDPSEMGRDLFADLRSRVDETRARRGEKESDRAAALTSFDALFAGVNATDAARRIMDANILKPASEAVAEKFGAEPLLEARLREALAETYSRSACRTRRSRKPSAVSRSSRGSSGQVIAKRSSRRPISAASTSRSAASRSARRSTTPRRGSTPRDSRPAIPEHASFGSASASSN